MFRRLKALLIIKTNGSNQRPAESQSCRRIVAIKLSSLASAIAILRPSALIAGRLPLYVSVSVSVYLSVSVSLVDLLLSRKEQQPTLWEVLEYCHINKNIIIYACMCSGKGVRGREKKEDVLVVGVNDEVRYSSCHLYSRLHLCIWHRQSSALHPITRRDS